VSRHACVCGDIENAGLSSKFRFEYLDRLSGNKLCDLAGWIVQVAEDACSALAGIDAGGNQAFVHTMHTESALASDLLIRVREAGIIGTSRYTESAADASLFTNKVGAVLALVC
jgi:hypothetical protein